MNNKAIWLVPAISGLVGCAHPFLKAGGNLATAINSGVTAVSSVADNEADTYRAYRFLSDKPYRDSLKTIRVPATPTSPEQPPRTIKVAAKLDSGFVGLACRPDADNVLISESVALDNLSKFQGFLKAQSSAPQDTSLASLIAGLRSDTRFALENPSAATDDLKKRRDKMALACAADVRNTFVAPSVAGFPPAPVLLAAWPKISQFITTLLTQADQAKREAAIIQTLTDPETRTRLKSSLDALEQSAKSGQLANLVIERKQLALWSAYNAYQHLAATSATDGMPSTYSQAELEAQQLASQLKTYNQLSAISLPEVVTKMQDAITNMEEAADTGNAPSDSVLGELLSAMQFLSDASSNYSGAQSALSQSKPSK